MFTITKKGFKVLIAILLFVSLNVAFFQAANSAEAASPSIWAHPNTAKKIGVSYSVTTTVSRADAVIIRQYLKDKDDGITFVGTTLAGLATAPMSAATGGLLTVGSSTIAFILTNALATDNNALTQLLLKSTAGSFQFKMTYRYYQKGSNDGAYMLTKLEIL